MKKILLLLLIIVGSGSEANADEYLLVMCKEDNVCRHMFKLINQDMRKHGKFILESHEEYNWLKWDNEINVYSKKYEESIYERGTRTGQVSAFDINNDGEDETVLFETVSVSGVYRDAITILPLSYYPRLKEKIYVDDIKKDWIHLFGGGSYELKDLPVEWVSGSRMHYINIGGLMFLRPLKIDSKYFISFFGSHRQGYPLPPMGEGNFIVISKYDANNTLNDICYFIRTYTWEQGKENK